VYGSKSNQKIEVSPIRDPLKKKHYEPSDPYDDILKKASKLPSLKNPNTGGAEGGKLPPLKKNNPLDYSPYSQKKIKEIGKAYRLNVHNLGQEAGGLPDKYKAGLSKPIYKKKPKDIGKSVLERDYLENGISGHKYLGGYGDRNHY